MRIRFHPPMPKKTRSSVYTLLATAAKSVGKKWVLIYKASRSLAWRVIHFAGVRLRALERELLAICVADRVSVSLCSSICVTHAVSPDVYFGFQLLKRREKKTKRRI